MKKQKFSITINAPASTVWNALWDETNYRKWTSAFAEGSHAVSDWNEGSKILFLDGKGDGMFSIIERKIPDKQMSFKHRGVVVKGTERPKNKEWANATENYYLTENGDVTELNVELDLIEEFEQYFKETFPKALDLVKQISES